MKKLLLLLIMMRLDSFVSPTYYFDFASKVQFPVNINKASHKLDLCMVSIPKSGSHLLAKCIYLIDKRTPIWAKKDIAGISQKEINQLNSEYLYCIHAAYQEKNKFLIEHNNLKTFFIYRDPRDQVVSLANWVIKIESAIPGHHNVPKLEDLITTLIYGCDGAFWTKSVPPYRTVEQLYRLFMPWMNHKQVYIATFEKLVGPQGGGSLELQLQEIKNIAKHMGKNITDEVAKEISKKIFGYTEGFDSRTFFEGQIGSWKKYFTDKHKREFKEVAGQLLIDLGYEKDLNW